MWASFSVSHGVPWEKSCRPRGGAQECDWQWAEEFSQGREPSQEKSLEAEIAIGVLKKGRGGRGKELKTSHPIPSSGNWPRSQEQSLHEQR